MRVGCTNCVTCGKKEGALWVLSLYWIINSISLHLWDLLKQAFFLFCILSSVCVVISAFVYTRCLSQNKRKLSSSWDSVIATHRQQWQSPASRKPALLRITAACERTCAACVSKSYLNIGWMEEHLSWSRKKKRTFAHAHTHTEAGFYPGGKSSMTVFGIDQRRMCNPLYGCLFRRFQSVLYFAVCLVVTFRVSVACKVIIQTIKPASFVSHTQQRLCVCVCLCLAAHFSLWLIFAH